MLGKSSLHYGNKAELAEVGREKRNSKLVQNANDPVLSTIDKTGEQHNTQQKLAKTAGVSTGTLASAEIIRRENLSCEKVAWTISYGEHGEPRRIISPGEGLRVCHG